MIGIVSELVKIMFMLSKELRDQIMNVSIVLICISTSISLVLKYEKITIFSSMESFDSNLFNGQKTKRDPLSDGL